METIDLHGLSLVQASEVLEKRLNNALEYGERIVRIIHGQGKHSGFFPVIKSHVRHWLEQSDFAKENVETVFRGEDGSPYTIPNAGETIIILTGLRPLEFTELSVQDEEHHEQRRNSKALRGEQHRKNRHR